MDEWIIRGSRDAPGHCRLKVEAIWNGLMLFGGCRHCPHWRKMISIDEEEGEAEWLVMPRVPLSRHYYFTEPWLLSGCLFLSFSFSQCRLGWMAGGISQPSHFFPLLSTKCFPSLMMPHVEGHGWMVLPPSLSHASRLIIIIAIGYYHFPSQSRWMGQMFPK